MRDTVAQLDALAQPIRDGPVDHTAIGQHVKGRSRVIGNTPARVSDPVGRQVDALLQREEKVEDRQITVLDADSPYYVGLSQT